MAGKKDRLVVAVISGLTLNQAAQISKDIMKSKDKYASSGRGVIAAGFTSSVSSLLQEGNKRIDIIDSDLPIIVNTLNKTYDRMGNVTCAAAAAGSGHIITVEEFYDRYNNS